MHSGKCVLGDKCRHAHGDKELRAMPPLNNTSSPVPAPPAAAPSTSTPSVTASTQVAPSPTSQAFAPSSMNMDPIPSFLDSFCDGDVFPAPHAHNASNFTTGASTVGSQFDYQLQPPFPMYSNQMHVLHHHYPSAHPTPIACAPPGVMADHPRYSFASTVTQTPGHGAMERSPFFIDNDRYTLSSTLGEDALVTPGFNLATDDTWGFI